MEILSVADDAKDQVLGLLQCMVEKETAEQRTDRHLADEFAHIYCALTRRGVSSEQALIWLNEVRQHSWRSRFSLTASRSAANLREVRDRLGSGRDSRRKERSSWQNRCRHRPTSRSIRQ